MPCLRRAAEPGPSSGRGRHWGHSQPARAGRRHRAIRLRWPWRSGPCHAQGRRRAGLEQADLPSENARWVLENSPTGSIDPAMPAGAGNPSHVSEAGASIRKTSWPIHRPDHKRRRCSARCPAAVRSDHAKTAPAPRSSSSPSLKPSETVTDRGMDFSLLPAPMMAIYSRLR